MATQSKNGKRRLREDYEKKKAQKKKSIRGQCETNYGECKKIASYSVTPTGQVGLSQLSRILNISRSEMLDQIGRGQIKLLLSCEGRHFIATTDSVTCVERLEVAAESLEFAQLNLNFSEPSSANK